MKILKPILIICATALTINLNGQVVVHFDYDNSGNRTGRQLTIEEMKSGDVQFPVKDINDIPVIETEEDQETEKDLQPVIYPNPSRGILKIDGLSIPSNTVVNLWLFNLSGVVLISKNESRNTFDLDISHLAD